ncbi:MAG: virginiamycin lyase [Candidatus Eremiobacteraeota bacterium]|jgi:streptogramin lyase|nr:virginiamycin lyase [Candidatus Eremiobacteraeota bacterium]
MMNRRLAFALLAALATVSCGGAHGSVVTPSPQRDAKTVSAQLTIVIPVRPQQSAARRPAFVSNGTQSGSISLNGAPTPARAFSLAAGAPNCTSTGGARTCTIVVDLPLGNDTVALATFDGALTSDGRTSGSLLASASVTQQIIESSANHVVISLLGVPASVTITSPQGSIPSNGTTTSVTLTVAVFDASGTQITGTDPFNFPININMQSTGIPSGATFRFSVNGGSPGGGQITSPNDTIALVYNGRYGSGTYTITATSNVDGHTLGASSTINVVPGFRLAQQIFANLANADLVQRFDTRDLWFTEPAAHKIGTLSANNVFTEFAVASGKEPRHIVYTNVNGVLGGGGAPFFVTEVPDTIGTLQTNGTITERSVPTPNAGLAGIAYDAGHFQLWFAEQTAAKIGLMTLAGGFTEYPVGIAGSAPASVALNNLGGGVFFTDPGTNAIGWLKPDHTVVEFAIPTANAGPSVIVGNTTNDTWFAEANAPKLGRMDNATGHITEYPAGDVVVSLIPGASDGFTTLWAITRNGTIEHFDASGNAVVVANALVGNGPPFIGTIGYNSDLWILRGGATISDLDELIY